MTRIVDLRLVLTRDDRLRVRVDGVERDPRGSLALALHEVARAAFGRDVRLADVEGDEALRADVVAAIG